MALMMVKRGSAKVCLIALVIGMQVCAAELGFNRDVRPILSDKCFACHGPDAKDIKGGLQLHTLEAATKPLGKAKDRRAIVPGDRKASELWLRITTKDGDELMPPPDSHHELTEKEIEALGAWIDQGAHYEGHWSFQPILKPKMADAIDGNGNGNGNGDGAIDWSGLDRRSVVGSTGAIDWFVAKRLADNGLSFSAEADKDILVRRLFLDLTGLPPTSAEIATFRSLPYEAIVDRLLASKASAERLAVDWLDGARYADTNGYSIDDHRDMWIWRDWVINAFDTNKPFDEFTVEQLAGDLLPKATEQQRVATGFLRNSMNTHEGGTIAEEYRVTYTADKVDTTATVFMGLTMKCAQCHDHKYDPITQKEYYSFFAFFNTSSESGKGATNANTAPLIEASSALCSTDRVKRDVGLRLADLHRLAAQPPATLATGRNAWEAATLPTLSPSKKAKQTSKAHSLFPKDPPKWIWAAENKVGVFAEFRREFTVESVPEEATIWLTCDDSAVVNLNGKRVGSMSLWTEPTIFSVKVKKGKNVLVVRAKNGANTPAGLLMSLAMRDKSGAVSYVATDKAWQARLDSKKPWAKSIELGKHGVKPWGNLYDGKKSIKKESPLYPALATTPSQRTLAQWRIINAAYAKKSGPFKIFVNQLELEEKVLKKTAETGRATAMIMDYKPRKTNVLIRGAYDQHGEEVQEGVPAVLPAFSGGPAGTGMNRLDLARWLVDPAHPLTARVIVNRYWQMLFHTGIVKTAEDFGAQGEYPSHPELLDWLAADFVENGWNVRRLLKQIVNTRTYRQSSAATPELLEKDPYNRLLARAPRFRLSAEFVRDSALVASGLLVPDVGGPSVHPYQPDGLWAEVSHYGYPRGFTAQKFLQSEGRGLYRRSMYTMWKRTSPPPSMAIFDAPSRETCTVRRLSTNTPLQALVLQNDPQFLEAARALGETMAAAGTVKRGVALGAERVLGRQPTADETRILEAAVLRYQHGYADRKADAESLISVGHSSVTVGDPALQAAWTLVASTLLNMDEAVTRQ